MKDVARDTQSGGARSSDVVRTGAEPTGARAEDTRTHRALAARSRVELLDALRRAGRPLSAEQAAELVGLHPNTARVHLERLLEVGFVRRLRESRTRPGRPRVLYASAVPDGFDRPDDRRADRPEDVHDGPAGTGAPSVDGYKVLARVLAAELAAGPDAAHAAEEAGRRWAAATGGRDWPRRPDREQTLAATLAVLDDLGFAPTRTRDGAEILLHRCPFEELARDHRGVVCGVHLGLIEGTVERLGGPVRVGGLEPFREEDPLLCAVQLLTGRTTPTRRRSSPRGGD